MGRKIATFAILFMVTLLVRGTFCTYCMEPASHESSAPASSPADPSLVAKQRRREGDTFQGQGRFEVTGDRIAFYSEANDEVFRVLENLALERIARILEDPGARGSSRKWSVTGVVTEYRGSNYLLIERAVLKAR